MGELLGESSRFEIGADNGRFPVQTISRPRRAGRGKNRPRGGHIIVSRKRKVTESHQSKPARPRGTPFSKASSGQQNGSARFKPIHQRSFFFAFQALIFHWSG
jgi:hypothetical protein